MKFIDQRIQDYCQSRSTAPRAYLRQLEKDTHLKTVSPQMIAGSYQGRLLSMISHLLRPNHILEIGTFTGYGSICLSEGLAPQGVLHTIEINCELEHIINKAIQQTGSENKIIPHIGDARDIIPRLNISFDLIYLDACKEDYLEFYKLLFEYWKSGGILIADNVLWDGKVLDPEHDLSARAISAFNDFVYRDERVENIVLPIRDGLNLIRKK